MKKRLLSLFLSLTGMMIFSITAYAGEINNAEQGIISAISGTYEYEGAYYKVTDAYIAKVANYLSRDDIDMTDSQVSSYISQFYANFATGIESGYLEKIGDVPTDSPGTDDTSGSGGGSNAGGTSGSGDTSNAGGTSGSGDTSNAGGTSGTGNGTVVNPDEVIKIESPKNGNSGLTEDGKIQDNTIGSTTDGVVEYTVFEIDENVMYVWDIDMLKVHKEAYKDSDVLGIVVAGDAVTVTGSATTGWARIEYNGEVGYISSAYLRTRSFMAGIMGDDENAEEDDIDESLETEDMTEETEDMEGQEEVVKDYSDAAPVAKQVNIATIAVIIAVILCVILGIVIFLNRNKMKNKFKNK